MRKTIKNKMVSHERKNINELSLSGVPLKTLPFISFESTKQDPEKKDLTKIAIFIGIFAGLITILNFFKES